MKTFILTYTINDVNSLYIFETDVSRTQLKKYINGKIKRFKKQPYVDIKLLRLKDDGVVFYMEYCINKISRVSMQGDRHRRNMRKSDSISRIPTNLNIGQFTLKEFKDSTLLLLFEAAEEDSDELFDNLYDYEYNEEDL